MYFLSLLIFFHFGYSSQFLVLDKLLDSCTYKSPKTKTNLSFANNLWNTSNKYLDVYFNFCDFINEDRCGKRSAACIVNKIDSSILLTGEKFIIDENNNFILDAIQPNHCKENPSKSYKLIINFCSNSTNDIPRLLETDNCEFEIQMMDPNRCSPTCTMSIYDRLFDLRRLNATYFVQSENKNFSVSLCRSNNLCKKDGVTACEISNGQIIPLSQGDVITLYNEEKMEVTMKGSYKDERGTKKLVILAICNWEITNPQLVYKPVQIQGKNYKFELKSRHACIKLPPKCEIFNNEDDSIYYNLKKLYKESGYWEVNVPNSRILLNICGPLKIDASNNSCTESYSQVCEVDKEMFINRGSIQTKFTILHDIISTKFISGATCTSNRTRQYTTSIDFKCSKIEEGPQFVEAKDCETFLTWKTPAACPLAKQDSCDFTNMSYDCTVYFNGHRYDFNYLTRHVDMYSIKDTDNATIEYLLNVCGPIVDDDAPCMKDAVVAVKYLKEVNIENKVKSLGKMYNMSVADNKIVLETTYGAYCEKHDYKSKIYFLCSDKDEPPQLINKTDCYFEFLFKTKAACPSPLELDKCSIKHPTENKVVDLRKLEKPTIKIVSAGFTFFYDICSGIQCSKSDNCIYPTYDGHLLKDNIIYLDFGLKRKCESTETFNRTLIKLTCNPISKNDNYKVESVSGCTLFMQLATNIACTEQELIVPLLEEPQDDNRKEYIVPQISRRKNCTTILNSKTGYTFDINTLNINISNVSCPHIEFSYPNNVVRAIYSTNKLCGGDVYEYEIILKCKNDNNIWRTPKFEKIPCREQYTAEGLEACKLLEESVLDSSSVGAGSIAATILQMIYNIPSRSSESDVIEYDIKLTSGDTIIGVNMLLLYIVATFFLRQRTYISVYKDHNCRYAAGIAISVVAVILLLIGLAIIGFIKFRQYKGRSSYNSVYIKSADL